MVVKALLFSILIQYVVESLGIGTIPARSVNSAKSESLHLIPVLNGPSSRVPQKIFLPMEKHRSVPYLMSSVANGIERQISRNCSIVI